MGLFDSICVESGLILDGKQRLIPIVETSKDHWVPLGLPIAGTNDRGGAMDVPSRLDDAMKRLVALGRTFVYGDKDVNAKKATLDTVLGEIRGDGLGATWNGKKVSFSLVDGGVFDAIVGIVKANKTSAWIRYAKLALQDRGPTLPSREPDKTRPKVDATTKRLAKAILDGQGDDARKVLLDHLLQREDPHAQLLAILPVLGKLDVAKLAELALPETHAMYSAADQRALKSALVELVRFRAWGTRLGPAYGEGQYVGYEATPEYAELTGCWSKPYSDHAREKYAGMPELIPAIATNEKSFKERGA